MKKYEKKKIINKTRKKTLANYYKICDTPASQVLGLMFSGFIIDRALVFDFKVPNRILLHMFFVFFPIDLIFLNSKYKVVEIKRSFIPFTFYRSDKKARYLIELPVGVINKSNTQVGDIIKY